MTKKILNTPSSTTRKFQEKSHLSFAAPGDKLVYSCFIKELWNIKCSWGVRKERRKALSFRETEHCDILVLARLLGDSHPSRVHPQRQSHTGAGRLSTHLSSPGFHYLVTLYKCQFPWASVVSSDTQELDPRISKSCFRFEILWPFDGRENGKA